MPPPNSAPPRGWRRARFELAAVARHADGRRRRQGAGDRRRIFQAARAVRPVDSTFQAIQHMLAELASCVAATIASAEAAARDADEGGLFEADVSRSPPPRAKPPISPSASPPSRTSRWAPWALPTSTSCITTRAGSGYGAATSAARPSGARRSARPTPRPAPRAVGLAQRQQIRGVTADCHPAGTCERYQSRISAPVHITTPV